MRCNNCGVELEDDMQICPLCKTPVSDALTVPASSMPGADIHSLLTPERMTHPQKKFTWEIVSLILLCSAITTLLVNFIINKSITWSEYPVEICCIIFCYISLFAFSDQSRFVKMMLGLILSSFCIVILDAITTGIQWSIVFGIPLLVISNVVTGGLIFAYRKARYKGINLIAYTFLGAALLCLFIEGLLSVYQHHVLRFNWSIIVAACVLPVVIVLLFVHFRLKRGRSLEKTFHV
ncbi:hypothetical protein GO495_06125 [Chitinophaga oryziterrae]|uniref:Zinc ribbon domain-containing protein n=1 Tax=Chitinophaga oryziterrae TaxID=1031224 RepID=A0A6N8J697_9BACT|nr:DUF6320 domain-containing protein [Chitinophaga oryziterrae]MVT40151.1 hypothetical protein [Chitinophaga oryziterrae]